MNSRILVHSVPRATLVNTGFRLLATKTDLPKSTLSSTPIGNDKTIENNIKSETNRLSKTLTKFWEKVDTAHKPESNEYQVELDQKSMKTPLGFPLSVPASKKELAYLVAHEWSNLSDLKVKTNALPITSIVARAIDLDSVYNHRRNVAGVNIEDIETKIGNLEDIKLNVLRYLDTDTCLIFATKEEYEGKLRARQDELYLPLIEEYNQFFTKWGADHGLLPEGTSVNIDYLDCETMGLRGNRQSITTQNIVLNWLDKLPIYDLVALEKAILTSKSFLCGVTLLRSNSSNVDDIKNIYQFNKDQPEDYYFKSIDEIIELGNLETIFQTEEWGEVEDTHDVDKVDWLRNLTSAALLCH